LEALRLENQGLYAKLEEFREPGYAVRKAFGVCWQAVIGRLRAIRRARKKGRPRPGIYPTGFAPYTLRQGPRPSSSAPRVLHAIGNLHIGGSAQLVVDLVERLGHRFQQRVLVRDLPAQPAYVGLDVDDEPVLRGTAHARACLEQARPDVLHVHFLGHHGNRYSAEDWRWYHRLFEAAGEYGCKVIENINIPVTPYVSPTVARYIFVSDYVRERFGHRDAPNLTIHPGSDLTLFTRPDSSVPPDDCVGMVYRLERDKLDETAIDVFIAIVRRRPGTRALIVGGGRFLDEYRRRVELAGVGGIDFTDYVAYDQLPGLYRRLSVFVAPTHTESFGQVTPFAMSMGLPVAGYRVGALAEILGDETLLAPPGDAAALADIVIGLLEDRARRLDIGRGNRARALEHFSVERMIERYAAVYDEVLEGR
jgi:glycosyltransferase involved in cell wall biosynthesis